jgi:hypothetical protein
LYLKLPIAASESKVVLRQPVVRNGPVPAGASIFPDEPFSGPSPELATGRRAVLQRAGGSGADTLLEAYLAEFCGFSLRLVDGLIGVDAAHIQWHSHGGPDEVPNGLALHHRLLDHGAITVGEDLRVRVPRSLAGSSARGLLEKRDGE